MAVLTNAALSGVAAYISGKIAAAKYEANGTVYDANSLETAAYGGNASITFVIGAGISGDLLITKVMLYDNAGNKWAEKNENISLSADGTGIAYRFLIAAEEIIGG